jgi:hypothetical protein
MEVGRRTIEKRARLAAPVSGIEQPAEIGRVHCLPNARLRLRREFHFAALVKVEEQ